MPKQLFPYSKVTSLGSFTFNYSSLFDTIYLKFDVVMFKHEVTLIIIKIKITIILNFIII